SHLMNNQTAAILPSALMARAYVSSNQNAIGYLILDIIHVTEYVWDVGTAFHGERGSERISWVREKLLAILESKVGHVIGGFKQMLLKNKVTVSQKGALQKAISYFENHRDMMDYKTYLEKGYPIATGVAEGACNSLVKDRMEQSGMRWTVKGATSILKQRAVKLNGDWNIFWQHYMQSQSAVL
ncbi:MAG: ISKra4 family transposase, partial [bacterium]